MDENKKKLYVITQSGIVEKTDDVKEYIREISTKEELEELIERMPYIPTILAPNKRAREELYQMAIKEYSDVEWVKVIKSVYLRVEDRHFEEFEPAYAENAKSFLYKEISIQFDIPFDEVELFVEKTVEEQLKGF